ncbi:MAG: type II secretion system protein [Polaromonas sp.]|uniref:type II secretion system protein n=1 Tax=Polaromonas sp. TaxID=1869339 RepID=UPI00184A8D57|nr:type II secretion system protein [Polaromonas sp.]NMM08677.1 type II secretion system protein [Polaromonas sp.]
MWAKSRRNDGFIFQSHKEQGVMLLGLLIFLAILGVVMTKTAEVWSTRLAREREQDLLFVGEQYRAAIERYYYATPGPTKALPLTLEDLVKDDRFPQPQHHLRQLYLDPVRGDDTWGVLRQGSRITGVYSLSDQVPLKKAGFAPKYAEFSAAQSYRGWLFIFHPPAAKIAGSALRAANKKLPNQAGPSTLRTP